MRTGKSYLYLSDRHRAASPSVVALMTPRIQLCYRDCQLNSPGKGSKEDLLLVDPHDTHVARHHVINEGLDRMRQRAKDGKLQCRAQN